MFKQISGGKVSQKLYRGRHGFWSKAEKNDCARVKRVG